MFEFLLNCRFVGGFSTLSPEYCFVVEDCSKIVGFALAALDARKFEEKLEAAWFPVMCSKYPLPKEKKDKEERLDSAEEMIVSMHQDQEGSFRIPEIVYKTHPSLLHLTVLPTIIDASVPKRLLSLVLVALKANGNYTFLQALILILILIFFHLINHTLVIYRFSWRLYTSFK